MTLEPKVFDAEIVDDQETPGEIVPHPHAPALLDVARTAARRAVEATRRPDRIAWALVRHEIYYGTLGSARGVAALWAWASARELDMHLATNPQLVLAARRARRNVALGGIGAGTFGATAAWVLLSPAVPIVALVALLAVAGAVERTRRGAAEADQGRAALGAHPGTKAVRRALVDAKLGKRVEDVRIVGPIVRVGNAWEATAELPPGVTYTQATKRRGELAAAIGVEEVQVALDPVRGHHGRVRLWVADSDPMQGARVTNPLISRAGAVDIWTDRVFAGRDARGRPVEFSLIERSYLIGGEPGGGKSVASTNVLAFAFSDPTVTAYLADGKFGFDLMAWEPMAHRVLTDKRHDAMLDMLEEVRAEMDRRYGLLRKLGVPKVTKDIARRHDLSPILVHIDEIQYWSASGDTKADKAFIAALADIVGRGRAAGIIDGAVTQRPAAEVVPTRLRDILSIRWALRCTTPDASDTVLGAGWAGRGYSASLFQADQRGAGYVLAEGTTPTQTRAAFIDPDRGEVDGIARRAYALREEAGTLPAVADRPDVRLLTAVLAAMGDTHKGAHTADILPRLGEGASEYAGWDAARLADALRPLGVAPVQLDIGGRNRNGYRRTDVQAALDRA